MAYLPKQEAPNLGKLKERQPIGTTFSDKQTFTKAIELAVDPSYKLSIPQTANSEYGSPGLILAKVPPEKANDFESQRQSVTNGFHCEVTGNGVKNPTRLVDIITAQSPVLIKEAIETQCKGLDKTEIENKLQSLKPYLDRMGLKAHHGGGRLVVEEKNLSGSPADRKLQKAYWTEQRLVTMLSVLCPEMTVDVGFLQSLGAIGTDIKGVNLVKRRELALFVSERLSRPSSPSEKVSAGFVANLRQEGAALPLHTFLQGLRQAVAETYFDYNEGKKDKMVEELDSKKNAASRLTELTRRLTRRILGADRQKTMPTDVTYENLPGKASYLVTGEQDIVRKSERGREIKKGKLKKEMPSDILRDVVLAKYADVYFPSSFLLGERRLQKQMTEATKAGDNKSRLEIAKRMRRQRQMMTLAVLQAHNINVDGSILSDTNNPQELLQYTQGLRADSLFPQYLSGVKTRMNTLQSLGKSEKNPLYIRNTPRILLKEMVRDMIGLPAVRPSRPDVAQSDLYQSVDQIVTLLDNPDPDIDLNNILNRLPLSSDSANQPGALSIDEKRKFIADFFRTRQQDLIDGLSYNERRKWVEEWGMLLHKSPKEINDVMDKRTKVLAPVLRADSKGKLNLSYHQDKQSTPEGLWNRMHLDREDVGRNTMESNLALPYWQKGLFKRLVGLAETDLTENEQIQKQWVVRVEQSKDGTTSLRQEEASDQPTIDVAWTGNKFVYVEAGQPTPSAPPKKEVETQGNIGFVQGEVSQAKTTAPEKPAAERELILGEPPSIPPAVEETGFSLSDVAEPTSPQIPGLAEQISAAATQREPGQVGIDESGIQATLQGIAAGRPPEPVIAPVSTEVQPIETTVPATTGEPMVEPGTPPSTAEIPAEVPLEPVISITTPTVSETQAVTEAIPTQSVGLLEQHKAQEVPTPPFTIQRQGNAASVEFKNGIKIKRDSLPELIQALGNPDSRALYPTLNETEISAALTQLQATPNTFLNGGKQPVEPTAETPAAIQTPAVEPTTLAGQAEEVLPDWLKAIAAESPPERPASTIDDLGMQGVRDFKAQTVSEGAAAIGEAVKSLNETEAPQAVQTLTPPADTSAVSPTTPSAQPTVTPSVTSEPQAAESEVHAPQPTTQVPSTQGVKPLPTEAPSVVPEATVLTPREQRASVQTDLLLLEQKYPDLGVPDFMLNRSKAPTVVIEQYKQLKSKFRDLDLQIRQSEMTDQKKNKPESVTPAVPAPSLASKLQEEENTQVVIPEPVQSTTDTESALIPSGPTPSVSPIPIEAASVVDTKELDPRVKIIETQLRTIGIDPTTLTVETRQITDADGQPHEMTVLTSPGNITFTNSPEIQSVYETTFELDDYCRDNNVIVQIPHVTVDNTIANPLNLGFIHSTQLNLVNDVTIRQPNTLNLTIKNESFFQNAFITVGEHFEVATIELADSTTASFSILTNPQLFINRPFHWTLGKGATVEIYQGHLLGSKQVDRKAYDGPADYKVVEVQEGDETNFKLVKVAAAQPEDQKLSSTPPAETVPAVPIATTESAVSAPAQEPSISSRESLSLPPAEHALHEKYGNDYDRALFINTLTSIVTVLDRPGVIETVFPHVSDYMSRDEINDLHVFFLEISRILSNELKADRIPGTPFLVNNHNYIEFFSDVVQTQSIRPFSNTSDIRNLLIGFSEEYQVEGKTTGQIFESKKNRIEALLHDPSFQLAAMTPQEQLNYAPVVLYFGSHEQKAEILKTLREFKTGIYEWETSDTTGSPSQRTISVPEKSHPPAQDETSIGTAQPFHPAVETTLSDSTEVSSNLQIPEQIKIDADEWIETMRTTGSKAYLHGKINPHWLDSAKANISMETDLDLTESPLIGEVGPQPNVNPTYRLTEALSSTLDTSHKNVNYVILSDQISGADPDAAKLGLQPNNFWRTLTYLTWTPSRRGNTYVPFQLELILPDTLSKNLLWNIEDNPLLIEAIFQGLVPQAIEQGLTRVQSNKLVLVTLADNSGGDAVQAKYRAAAKQIDNGTDYKVAFQEASSLVYANDIQALSFGPSVGEVALAAHLTTPIEYMTEAQLTEAAPFLDRDQIKTAIIKFLDSYEHTPDFQISESKLAKHYRLLNDLLHTKPANEVTQQAWEAVDPQVRPMLTDQNTFNSTMNELSNYLWMDVPTSDPRLDIIVRLLNVDAIHLDPIEQRFAEAAKNNLASNFMGIATRQGFDQRAYSLLRDNQTLRDALTHLINEPFDQFTSHEVSRQADNTLFYLVTSINEILRHNQLRGPVRGLLQASPELIKAIRSLSTRNMSDVADKGRREKLGNSVQIAQEILQRLEEPHAEENLPISREQGTSNSAHPTNQDVAPTEPAKTIDLPPMPRESANFSTYINIKENMNSDLTDSAGRAVLTSSLTSLVRKIIPDALSESGRADERNYALNLLAAVIVKGSDAARSIVLTQLNKSLQDIATLFPSLRRYLLDEEYQNVGIALTARRTLTNNIARSGIRVLFPFGRKDFKALYPKLDEFVESLEDKNQEQAFARPRG